MGGGGPTSKIKRVTTGLKHTRVDTIPVTTTATDATSRVTVPRGARGARRRGRTTMPSRGRSGLLVMARRIGPGASLRARKLRPSGTVSRIEPMTPFGDSLMFGLMAILSLTFTSLRGVHWAEHINATRFHTIFAASVVFNARVLRGSHGHALWYLNDHFVAMEF